MNKAKINPQKLFYSIGEVSEIAAVKAHVLRYWETEFSMLRPEKNVAGQRVYRQSDLELVQKIKELLYTKRFTIAGARKHLAETRKEKKAVDSAETEIKELKATLEKIKAELLLLKESLDNNGA